MSGTRRTLVRLAVALAVLAGASPAAAEEERLQMFRNEGFTRRHGSNPLSQDTAAGGCIHSAMVTVQEMGKSGVTRLRAQFQLRAKYDTRAILPTYAKSSWDSSKEFPDDGRSFWGEFGHAFRQPPGEYSMWIKAVGERPSFWSPDLMRLGNLGVVGCSGLVSSPGVG